MTVLDSRLESPQETPRHGDQGKPLAARGGGLERLATVLAALVMLCSALHFWPLEGNKRWEALAPTNVALAAWLAGVAMLAIARRRRSVLRDLLPPPSVLAYLGIVILSVAFAPDTARAVSYAGKLVLALGGGYALFALAARGSRGRRAIMLAACLAAAVATAGCLCMRLAGHADSCGFFGSPHKYGTYAGLLAPLCATWLMLSGRRPAKLLGALLAAAGIASVATLGGLAAISVGLATAACLAGRWSSRVLILGVLIVSVGAALAWPGKSADGLRRDMALRESDGTNLRQRYIQWQALVNLLQERTVTGAGAGCLNTYRSEFYGRLPKLNTLAPFDENGYLAAAAEGGIFALACLSWLIASHLQMGWRRVRVARRLSDERGLRDATAALAALAGACVANLFSAVQYNGIVIVFAAVLAMNATVTRERGQNV